MMASVGQESPTEAGGALHFHHVPSSFILTLGGEDRLFRVRRSLERPGDQSFLRDLTAWTFRSLEDQDKSKWDLFFLKF